MKAITLGLLLVLAITAVVMFVPNATAARGVALGPSPTPSRTPTPINVGNFVWDDLDKDGRQDAGEPGLEGVSVQLWNAAMNDLIDTDETDADGFYALTAPTPGDYRVRVLLVGGDTFSPMDQAGGDDTLDSDIITAGGLAGFTEVYTFAPLLISIVTIDAGVIKFRTPTPTRTPTPIQVGNFVWNDLDQDGEQDEGEPGIKGLTVQLWNAAMDNLIDSGETDGNGFYVLTAPTPGDYRVRVVVGPGDVFSPKDAADDIKDSDVNSSGGPIGFTDIYTFGSSLISITTIDAGVIPSVLATVTPTPSNTPTASNTPTFTQTATSTTTGTATATPTLTATPTSTIDPSEPPTQVPSRTAMPTPTQSSACANVKPDAPQPLLPPNRAKVDENRVLLDWTDVACASSYKVVVRQSNQNGTRVDRAKVRTSTYRTKNLSVPDFYFWRVKACNPPNGCSKGYWQVFRLLP